MRSERVDAFAAALLSQRLAGGDLAGLLRRFAAGAAERDRVAEDARSATAQARFTGLLVVAMPSGGALFAELVAARLPRQAARLRRPAAAMLALAGGPAARRLRRDPPHLAGGRVEPGRRCSSALAVLLGCAALARAGRPGRARPGASPAWRRRPLGGARPRRRCASACRSGCAAPASSTGCRSAAVLAAKLACAAAGGLAALRAAPAAPGRHAPLLVALGLPAAGFLVPDALLERAARRRRRRLLGALPDALDLLAVSAGSGRGPGGGPRAAGEGGGGAAGRGDRGSSTAELACGAPLGAALAALRRRVPGSEVATLVASIERSRRFGSPLADQLRRQASALRRDSRRATEERAARAAPKIQLVVALVLVPSVLLMIAAGLIANAGTLLAGF